MVLDGTLYALSRLPGFDFKLSLDKALRLEFTAHRSRSLGPQQIITQTAERDLN
jgi:hypothetical protein